MDRKTGTFDFISFFFLRPPGARTFRVSFKKIICELGPPGYSVFPLRWFRNSEGRPAVPEESEEKFFGSSLTARGEFHGSSSASRGTFFKEMPRAARAVRPRVFVSLLSFFRPPWARTFRVSYI